MSSQSTAGQRMRRPGVLPRSVMAGIFLLLELPLLLPIIVGAILMALVIRVGALRRRGTAR